MAEVHFLRKRGAGNGCTKDHDPLTDELTLLGLDVGANGVDLGGVGSITGLVAGVNPTDGVNLAQLMAAIAAIPTTTAASGGGVEGTVAVDSDFGLDVAAGVLSINLESDGGIVFDSTNFGLEINLEAVDPTLQIVGNELGVKVAPNCGLTVTADGLKAAVDNTTVQINPTTGELEAVGVEKASYTADGTINAGDPVYFSSDNTVQSAQADSTFGPGDTGDRVFAIACVAAATGAVVEVASSGEAAGVLTGLGATAGDIIYLDTAGGLSTTCPSTDSDTWVKVGWAVNATDLYIDIHATGAGSAV